MDRQNMSIPAAAERKRSGQTHAARGATGSAIPNVAATFGKPHRSGQLGRPDAAALERAAATVAAKRKGG
jgi:hypothetical protein